MSPELKIILKVVKSYLNKEVFFGYPNSERPRYDYVVMYLIDEKTIGFGQKNISDDGKTLTLKKMFDLQVCFDCIGKNPYSFASQLTTMWELPSIYEELIENGIAWHKSSSMRNTTILLDENYQQRLNFEAHFYIEKTATESTYFIEKVELNGINQ